MSVRKRTYHSTHDKVRVPFLVVEPSIGSFKRHENSHNLVVLPASPDAIDCTSSSSISTSLLIPYDRASIVNSLAFLIRTPGSTRKLKDS
jgi:hypothetical protein